MKNEYAFPFDVGISASIGRAENPGMTLRDYFAAKALQGMYANPSWDNRNVWGMVRWAYQAADAMIEVRNETNQ